MLRFLHTHRHWQVYAFDPIRHSTFQAWNGEFEELAEMPRARARHASAVVDGRVCVYGGRNLTDALIAEVDCYDPAADAWSTPTALPAERQASDWTAFTAEDGRVHLVGGYDQGYAALDRVTVVDMSDMDAVAYSDGPGLRTKRGDIDSAVVDGVVYVSGGFTHENDFAHPLNSVERLDPAAGEWSTVDALNDERGDKQLVALDGRVYALGGEQKVDVSGVPAAELPELGARSELLDSVEVRGIGRGKSRVLLDTRSLTLPRHHRCWTRRKMCTGGWHSGRAWRACRASSSASPRPSGRRTGTSSSYSAAR